MEKILNKLINHVIKGVDTYTHNGSTWLIFTESKQWVIELTESKTLWYNYNFFKNAFVYVSLDVVENQHYITKWVEDNIVGGVGQTQRCSQVSDRLLEVTIQNGVKENSLTYVSKIIGCVGAIENGVKETHDDAHNHKDRIDGVIENGVKETELHKGVRPNAVGEAIQNGVKETMFNQGHQSYTVKNIIENGVRHTLNTEYMPKTMVEDIIENGVKETRLELNITEGEVEEIIENGVKETNSWDESIVGELNQNGLIEEIIENGIKETKTPGNGDIRSTIEWMEENKYDSYTKMIDDVIDYGIKEVRPLPEQSGELRGYGDYYKLKEDRTKAFIDYLEDTIKFGVKSK